MYHKGRMFTVEIVKAKSPGPEFDRGMPVEKLPGEFASPDTAADAAQAFIRNAALVGVAWYRILDASGKEIALDA